MKFPLQSKGKISLRQKIVTTASQQSRHLFSNVNQSIRDEWKYSNRVNSKLETVSSKNFQEKIRFATGNRGERGQYLGVKGPESKYCCKK